MRGKMLDEKFVVNVVLHFHEISSAVTSNLLTIPAFAVYLYALAVLLLAAIMLFIIRWRYKAGIRRRKIMEDVTDSLDTQTPIYENLHMTKYQQLISKDISDDEFDSSDRDYDNVP